MTRRHSTPAIDNIYNIQQRQPWINNRVFCPSGQHERYWMASLMSPSPSL